MAPQPPRPEATWKPRWSYASSTDSSLLGGSSPFSMNRVVCFVSIICAITFALGVALAFVFFNKETETHPPANLTDRYKYEVLPHVEGT